MIFIFIEFRNNTITKKSPSKVEIFTLLGDFVYAIPFSFLLSFLCVFF